MRCVVALHAVRPHACCTQPRVPPRPPAAAQQKWADKGKGTLTLRRSTAGEGAGQRPYFVFTTDSGEEGGQHPLLACRCHQLLQAAAVGSCKRGVNNVPTTRPTLPLPQQSARSATSLVPPVLQVVC